MPDSEPIELYTIPIAARPAQSWSRLIFALASAIVFDIGCSMINATQFVFLLPLRLLPFTWARELYEEGIRYTKGAAGCLFSEPSSLIILMLALNVCSSDVPVIRPD